MIKVIYIKNTYEPSRDREVKEYEYKGKKLSAYLPPLNNPIVSLNQKKVNDFDIIVPDNSEIIIAQKQTDPVSSFFTSLLYGAFAGGVATATTMTAISIGASVLTGAVTMAGSMLLSSLLTPKVPNYSTSSISESPTYSFAKTTTLSGAGGVIPILFGKHQTGGTRMQRYIDYVGDDEYLYLQILLCQGEIEDITADDISINDTLISNYEDAEFRFTNGTLNQGVMDWFGDIESPNSFTVALEDTPITRQTIGNANKSLRLFISFASGLYYSNDSGGLDSRSVTLKVEYKKTSDATWIDYGNQTYSAAQTTAFSREIRIDGLTPDAYDVKITRITAVSTNPREVTNCDWSGIGEIIKDDLNYPSYAMLGIKVKATGQLSGSVDVITQFQRKTIEVFNQDGVSIGFKDLSNPAWAFWDLLTSSIYGYEIPYTKMYYFDEIVEWANWCDELVESGITNVQEKRCTFNGIFDFEGNVWDSLISIAQVGRAAPIIKGTKYSVIVDKPTPRTFTFNMGNIKKGTLEIAYVGDEDLANQVEVQYTNVDKDYSNDTVTLANYTDEVIKTTSIQQMGVVNESQAYRIAKYHLNCNEKLRRVATFEVGLDAINCEVGDVGVISHDMPLWNTSGRLVSATSTTVTLDQEVLLTNGETYTLEVKMDDDTLETFDIVFSGTQTVTELTINGTFTQTPKQYNLFTLCNNPNTEKLFRITDISRAVGEFDRQITAIEYNESILTDDSVVLSTVTPVTELSPTANTFLIKERGEVNAQGVLIPFLSISWKTTTYATCNLYISKDGGLTYTQIATDLKTTSFDYNAIELEANKQYFFKVSCKGLSGDYQPLKSSLMAYHVFIGDSTATTSTTKEKLDQLLYDNGLLQKAIQDGLVTIYTGTTTPTNPSFYDLWKLNVADLTIGDYLFDSVEIKNLTLNDTSTVYKYFNENSEWVLCNPSQIAFIDSTVSQLSIEALADGKARIFTTTPVAPYDIGDMWIQDGGDILFSSVNQTVAYNPTDFGIKPKYTDDTTINNFVNNTYPTDLAAIQSQIDGNITSWFYDYAPTLSNEPALSWTTETLKANHLGDLFYDNTTGYSYRWKVTATVYSWLRITDSDITKALSDASKAQDTADSKRRVFVVTPTVPYDIGDLWADGSDLKKCIVAKTDVQSYSISDWELATNYTDDTLATTANDTANTAKVWVESASSLIVDPSTGLITGWSYADASNEQSLFSISADTFRVSDPTNTNQLLYSNGSFRTYDADGNYSQLSAGSLQFYKASEDTSYKYLKFVQSGTVANGETVTLTGFDKLPSVIVSPADLEVYDHTASTQSQTLKTYPASLQISNGVVTFVPTAQLVLSGTSNLESLSWNYSTSSTVTTSSATTPANTTKIEVLVSLNSTRSTGTSGTYYKRKSSSQMQIFVNSAWVDTGAAVVVNHTDLTTDSANVVSDTLTSGQYTYRVVTTYSDLGGTFNTSATYTYFSRNVSDATEYTMSNLNAGDLSSITLSGTLNSGEEFISSSYSADISLINAAYSGNGSDSVSLYLAYSDGLIYRYSDNPINTFNLVGSYDTKTFITCSVSNLSTLSATTKIVASINGTDWMDFYIKNRVLTLNLRKPASTSTTASNTLNNGMATYTLSTETQLSAGTVNYIAIG